MSTRSSSSNLVPPSTNPDSIIRNRRRNLGDPSLLLDFEEIYMANDPNNVQGPPLVGPNFQNPNPDLRPMEELLQAPTDVTAIAFHGFENDDPHSHIRRFTKITQTVKLNNVPSDVVKLLLFPFSLEGAAWTWLQKERPNSITTWNDLVCKFVKRLFPPSKTTNLRNEITRFQHRFVGGNFLTKNTKEALTIIENKSKVQTSRNKPQVSSASGSSTQDAAITALTKQVEALVSSLNRPISSIQNGCETCGGPHAYYECQAAGGYTQEDALQERPRGVLPRNTVPNPREDLKVIITRSGVTIVGPSVPHPPLSSSKEVERDPKLTTDQVLTESTTRVLSPVIQPSPAFELPPAPASSSVIPERNPHQPPIPYPSRLNKEKLQDKSDIQIHSFLQMFKKLYFNISFVEALTHMPK
ncbi:reverse transcriptase domain-containing protein, partial [Tanacetum coccineum]